MFQQWKWGSKWSQYECTYEAVKSHNFCKYFWSQSFGNWYETGLPEIWSIPCFFDVCQEDSSRTRVLLYSVLHRSKFCGSNQWILASAQCSHLCTNKKHNSKPLHSQVHSYGLQNWYIFNLWDMYSFTTSRTVSWVLSRLEDFQFDSSTIGRDLRPASIKQGVVHHQRRQWEEICF